MAVPGGYSGRLWTGECQPQFWSKYQVWEWLQQMIDMYQIDASSMPLHNFDVDGGQLCSMSYQDFLHAAGSVGAMLYHSLAELRLTGGWEAAGHCRSPGLLGSVVGLNAGWNITQPAFRTSHFQPIVFFHTHTHT